MRFVRRTVLGVGRVQRAEVGEHDPAPADTAGVVVDDALHGLFVQTGRLGVAAQA
jgi:hypothetical protein